MEKTPICQNEYDFTLVLNGVAEVTQELEDGLFEAGCNDATLSSRSGRVFLTFSRSAPSLKDAILSAIQAVEDANVGATVLRVDACDLVTQAEIARRISRSRQQVHQYMTGERGPGKFPPPACYITDQAPLWYWCEVANWLWENKIISEQSLQEARDFAMINCVLELRSQQQISPELAKEVIAQIIHWPA